MPCIGVTKEKVPIQAISVNIRVTTLYNIHSFSQALDVIGYDI